MSFQNKRQFYFGFMNELIMKNILLGIAFCLPLLTGCGGGNSGSGSPGADTETPTTTSKGQQQFESLSFQKDLSADLSQHSIITLIDDIVQNSPALNLSNNIKYTGYIDRNYQNWLLSHLPWDNFDADATPCAEGGSASDNIQGSHDPDNSSNGDVTFKLRFQSCSEISKLPHYSYAYRVDGELNGYSQWEYSIDSGEYISLSTEVKGNMEQSLSIHTTTGKAGLLLNYTNVNSTAAKSRDDQFIYLNDNFTVYFEMQMSDKKKQPSPLGGEIEVITLEPLVYTADGRWYPVAGKLQITDSDQVAIVEYTGDDGYRVTVDSQTFEMETWKFGSSIFKGLLIKATMQDMTGIGFRRDYIDGSNSSSVGVALFENGDASFEATNILNPAGREVSKKDRPGDWRQWKKDDSGLYFGSENNWSKLPSSGYRRQNEQGVRFNGTFENIYSFSSTVIVKSFYFSENGFFSRSGSVSSHFDNSLDDGWSSSYFESPDKQGIYEVDDYLLTLRYGSGRTEYKVIVYWFESDGSVDVMTLNDSVYIR